MEEYLQRLDDGVRKYGVRCEEFRKKIADLAQQEKAAMAERENLTKIVERQNLSEVDIHRLTSDRQTLDGKLKAARTEREEKSRRTYDLEIKRSQAYNTIERMVEEYEAKATKLGLLPNPPKGYEHIDFHQELNGSASTPAAMVPDCTTVIKPALIRLKQDTMVARREEEEKVLSLEEEMADLKDKINTRAAECEDAETRYKALVFELNNAKEVITSSNGIDVVPWLRQFSFNRSPLTMKCQPHIQSWTDYSSSAQAFGQRCQEAYSQPINACKPSGTSMTSSQATLRSSEGTTKKLSPIS